jgi:subtilisin family serine protease
MGSRSSYSSAPAVCVVLMVFVAALVCAGSGCEPRESATQKTKIAKQDDLPRHTYEVTGTVTELVQSPAAFAPFAAAVRADIEADLETYDIEDPTTLSGLQGTLLSLDILDGHYEAALERIAALRQLEEKPGLKLITGTTSEARIAALQEVGGEENLDEYREAFRRHYSEKVEALPWDLVQDIVQQNKAQLEIASENLVLGLIQEQLEPMVAETREVSGDIARRIVGFHDFVQHQLPIKDEMIAVLTDTIDRHHEEKQDIWAARDLNLMGHKLGQPVLVAIWDTGVDPFVYEDVLFENPDEDCDAKDNDGNGHIDDVHGLAFDLLSRPTTGYLYPMDGATRPIEELQSYAKGLFDMQAALDTPDARGLKLKMSQLDPSGVKPFIEDLTRYTLYSHGTHVAGIAIASNPAARILIVRLTGDPKMIPTPPTMELARNTAESAGDVVAYFKKHGVRVVNMSWVIIRSALENDLEMNGIGQSPEERKRMAREMFDVMKQGLFDAFKSAPEILFVGGAGNSDNDVEFDEFIPPMFDLPNLLIAGAVDQAGEATTFTSFGPTVNVYANGFEVESYVPGGDRLAFSGTSMAAPNVANLAAKLIALAPELTPTEVIELILDGADEVRQGDQVMRVVHPKRSAELLAKQRGS